MTKLSMVARLYDQDGSSILAKVRLIITTIPEVPEVVTLGVKTYVLTTSAPLSYHRVTSSEAKKI